MARVVNLGVSQILASVMWVKKMTWVENFGVGDVGF